MLSKDKLALCIAALLVAACIPSFAASSAVANGAMADSKSEVRALLAEKANVNTPQADGATGIQWAAYNSDLEMADVLIAAGADVKKRNSYAATALSLACINGNAAMIEKLLAAGADVNERRPNGETALMLAARTGTVDAIKVLLAHGAKVNARGDLRGTTALMWAAEQGHPDAVRVLIEHGAESNAGSAVINQKGAKPNLGNTVEQELVLHFGPNALAAAGLAKPPAPAGEGDAAATYGRANKVGGMTALHFAAREDDAKSARLLVEAKADVNQVTVDGWSPLLVATQNRNYKLA